MQLQVPLQCSSSMRSCFSNMSARPCLLPQSSSAGSIVALCVFRCLACSFHKLPLQSGPATWTFRINQAASVWYGVQWSQIRRHHLLSRWRIETYKTRELNRVWLWIIIIFTEHLANVNLIAVDYRGFGNSCMLVFWLQHELFGGLATRRRALYWVHSKGGTCQLIPCRPVGHYVSRSAKQQNRHSRAFAGWVSILLFTSALVIFFLYPFEQ